jgi:hypothetical protein
MSEARRRENFFSIKRREKSRNEERFFSFNKKYKKPSFDGDLETAQD